MPVFLSDYTDISQYHLHRGLQQEQENSIQILETHTTEGIQNQISKQFSSSEENMVKDASNDMKKIVQLKSALLIEMDHAYLMTVTMQTANKLVISGSWHGMTSPTRIRVRMVFDTLTAVQFHIKDAPYALTA